jgi:hypothetical protein
VLTVDGTRQRGSRIGWEVEMNGGGRQSSLGGHVKLSVVGMAALSAPFIGRRVGRKGVGMGCALRRWWIFNVSVLELQGNLGLKRLRRGEATGFAFRKRRREGTSWWREGESVTRWRSFSH